MKLHISVASYPEMNILSENPNKMIVCYFGDFATHDQANWPDYLPLV